MLDPRICKPGKIEYEIFYKTINGHRIKYYQYDYRRSIDGKLFSCIGNSIFECEKKIRDQILKERR